MDAIDYYTNEEVSYKEKCDDEKLVALRKALGISFVSFDNEQMAARVYSDFKVTVNP